MRPGPKGSIRATVSWPRMPRSPRLAGTPGSPSSDLRRRPSRRWVTSPRPAGLRKGPTCRLCPVQRSPPRPKMPWRRPEGSATPSWSRQRLEEAPSPGISPEVREKMTEAAVRLAREAGYANAGTVEFLVKGDDFYFIEMNTRIQVEHPVTEMLTGVDLVKEQIRVAGGELLSVKQEDVPMVGHAMEFRINAEDPEKDFMPSPGEISFLDVPGGPGVRVDSGIYQGYSIPPFYDSMVGKLIVWALTREEVINRARRALREYRLEGIKTTIPLHTKLLEKDLFRSGEYHTGYLEELLSKKG